MPTPATGRGARRAKRVPGEEFLARRPGSPHWHYDITIDGRRLRGSCGTAEKEAAGAYALQQREGLWREVKLGERPARHLTLEEAFTRFYREVGIDTSYGQQAQRHQMAAMLPLLGRSTRLADLCDASINDMVQALKRKEIVPHNRPEGAPRMEAPKLVSGSTINRYLSTLQVVCNRATHTWGIEVGKWDKKQHRQQEPRGREVFLDHAQARELVAAVIPHARAILLLDLMTGLRKANAHGLRWENVSLDMGRAILIGKGDKPLAITLPAPAVLLLERLQPDPEKRKGPVFVFGNPTVGCDCAACKSPGRRGKAIASTKRAFATAAAAIGVPKLRFHDMRHTFASWLLDSTGDLKLVQEALGHADITTTTRYAHLMAGRKDQAIAGAVAGLFEAPILLEKKA